MYVYVMNTTTPWCMRSSNFWVSRSTNSNWDFGLIRNFFEKYESLDLVDFGVVAFSVESVIPHLHIQMFIFKHPQMYVYVSANICIYHEYDHALMWVCAYPVLYLHLRKSDKMYVHTSCAYPYIFTNIHKHTHISINICECHKIWLCGLMYVNIQCFTLNLKQT